MAGSKIYVYIFKMHNERHRKQGVVKGIKMSSDEKKKHYHSHHTSSPNMWIFFDTNQFSSARWVSYNLFLF